jgi:uncharacterized protein YraI
MKCSKWVRVLTAALLVLPTVSFAALAYTSKDANLRAGPAAEYPVIAIIQAGTSLSIEGCQSDYEWCDVTVGPYRGWLYAGNIAYPYQGANVPVLGYGAAIGLGIIAFNLGSYWDDHYRTRPWYPQRQQWIDRPRSGFSRGDQTPPGWRPGNRNDGNRTGIRPGSNRPSPTAPGLRPGSNRPSPTAPGVRPGSNRLSPARPAAGGGANRPSPARPAAGGGGNHPSQGKDDKQQRSR